MYVKICETVTVRLLPILCPSYRDSMLKLRGVQSLIGHHLCLNEIKTSLHSGQYFASHLRKLYIAKILAPFIKAYFQDVEWMAV